MRKATFSIVLIMSLTMGAEAWNLSGGCMTY